MMYVMCLYQALPHTAVPLFPSAKKSDAATPSADFSAVRGPFGLERRTQWRQVVWFVFVSLTLRRRQGGGARRTTTTTTSSSGYVDSATAYAAYQTLMEEVLVWLLAAEDHVDSAPAIEAQLQPVKEQFHKHEVRPSMIFSKDTRE